MDELQVKAIINQRNISVQQFAQMLGVTREHCYNIINGKNLSKKQLANMSRVLNLPIRDLYQIPDDVVSDDDPYEIVFGRKENYRANDIIIFSKLSGTFGALSNMSREYSIDLFGHHCPTSEHLFIAMRFSGYPDLQREILEYKNSMWCKKIFVNGNDYKQYHHPNWQDNYFDVEVMKYIINLKYQQNKEFRKLLDKTKGKIIVEDTTMQNSSDSIVRWGCQDLQKKDLIKQTRASVRKYITFCQKEEALKKPLSASSQKLREQKIKQWKASVNRVQEIYEQVLLEHCHYNLCGENAMGKILTVVRDQGGIDCDIKYPLYFFEHEIK